MKSKTVWQWIITSVLVSVLAVFQGWRVQAVKDLKAELS